jgi:hypothetical protein
MEMTKKSRSDLHNSHIQDILFPPAGQTFHAVLRQVRPRMAHLTTLQHKGREDREPFYEAKLTRVTVEGKRLISVVLHEPIEK